MSIWYAYSNISKAGTTMPYAGDCSPYADLSGTPWFDTLTKNIPAIQDKVLELLAQKNADTQQYYNTTLVEKGKWESKAFLVWNLPKRTLKAEGKALFSYFENIPGLVSLSISVLKPGTHVKPHNGDTDAIYRMHIPVLIPAGLPECGIKVDTITKPWADNKVIAFCDAHLHEAWNYSGKTRIILIADVVRAEYLSQTRIICAKVLAWLLLQKVLQPKPIRSLPFFLKAIIARILFLVAVPIFMLLQKSGK